MKYFKKLAKDEKYTYPQYMERVNKSPETLSKSEIKKYLKGMSKSTKENPNATMKFMGGLGVLSGGIAGGGLAYGRTGHLGTALASAGVGALAGGGIYGGAGHLVDRKAQKQVDEFLNNPKALNKQVDKEWKLVQKKIKKGK